MLCKTISTVTSAKEECKQSTLRLTKRNRRGNYQNRIMATRPSASSSDYQDVGLDNREAYYGGRRHKIPRHLRR